MPLIAVLAFLLPVGVYCLILAAINRRSSPVVVSGAVDSIGLLFACSGFTVVTVPMLFGELYLRNLGVSSDIEHFFVFFVRSWIVMLAYYLMLMTSASLMILWRVHKTMIYNVDVEQFSGLLQRTLTQLGLGTTTQKPRLIITALAPAAGPESTAITEAPPSPAPGASLPDGRYAELVVESFPSMCHITLHWDNYASHTRQQIEEELARTLEPAAPMDNAAAGWFLSVSGLIFGVVVMAVVTAAFLMVFFKR